MANPYVNHRRMQSVEESNRPNFAPPPIPPEPPETSDRSVRSRRPSSPTAASIHSQRTIRSSAASNRLIEDLETKVRLLERKRLEDRELKQELEKAQQERDHCKGIIEKLQSKYRPQQQELEKLKREHAVLEQTAKDIEELRADHEQEMESALLDREVAEETAECLKADLEILRGKNEEMQEELEVLREESEEMNRDMSPEERASTGWIQLQNNNERLKEALLSLRDLTRENEAELKEQIGSLEDQVKEFDALKREIEESKEKLLKSEADTIDLRQQLEVAMNAEEMIEQLTEDNMNLRDRVNEFKGAIEDLESLRELNDELELNHIEAEKQLQEEIDFKDSLLLDRERTAKEQQAALDEADYNIGRFRDLVRQLTSDLQDLEASKQISESEAAELSNKSKAMVDLNQRLQSSAAKTQVKTIDLELRKLDAMEASEHLSIVQLFLPESFQDERDSVLAFLRFKRVQFKATLVHDFIKERIASFGARGDDEDIFAACDAMDQLVWIAAMSERFVNSVSSCSIDEFSQFGSALYELEVVERTLNDYIDGLRRDDLREADMTVRLRRSIEVMTHLASLHIRDSLADHTDHLYMRTLCLQSHLETSISALMLTHMLMEKHMPTKGDYTEDSEQDEDFSDANLIMQRLKSVIELARSAKVISGKTHRALFDLQTRSLTLEQSLAEPFENVEKVAAEISIYTRQSGASLHSILHHEEHSDVLSPLEVAGVLSRTASSVFSLSVSEAGPYVTLAGRLRDIGSLLSEVSLLPTDLDNTIEFERSSAPWIARAEQLSQTKIVSIDTAAELARVRESVRERDTMLKGKEAELEEQSVRIEMLEARMKDASKRSARIAELERALHEAKEAEKVAKNDLLQARHEAQRDVDMARSEMTRIVEEHGQLGHAEELDGNAVGANARYVMKRQEHKILGLEGAIRFLKEENFRLRLPPPDAPVSVATSMDWLHAPLQTPTHPRQKQFQTLQRKGANVLEQMLELASRPHVVDLTALPENKLAWRPAKESSRWRVERRNEEWLDWKQWREDLVRQAQSSRPGYAAMQPRAGIAVPV
jgi:dynactin 1